MSLNSANGFGAFKPMPQDDYQISERLINHVKQCEGFRPIAERDILADPPVYTIGYGSTFGVHAGQHISDAAATERLERELHYFGVRVSQLVRVPLTQGQWEALTDFCFNVGAEAFAHSTMCKLLNAGDYIGAANEFSKWVYAGPQKLIGLIRRRRIESNWFTEVEEPQNA